MSRARKQTRREPATLVDSRTIAIVDSDSDSGSGSGSESDEYDVVAVRSTGEQLSKNRRRVVRTIVPVAAASPVKRARRTSPPRPSGSAAPVMGRAELGADLYDIEDGDMREESGDKGTPVVKPADESMARWQQEHRDTYLDALFWRDGCGQADEEPCLGCGDLTKAAIFRCEDCVGGGMLCAECCVDAHRCLPLHKISVPMERFFFFERHTLKALGLRVQLGQHTNTRCSAPHAAHGAFVVLHDNGIHEVAVDFCGCERQAQAGSRVPQVLHHHLQLLRHGWYPSTDMRPRTCATFTALDRFMLYSHQSKMTAYDFYRVLERLTDNTGVEPPRRYQPFLRMARQWRHLMLLKRAGWGHDESGVHGTKPGALALLCPVCPRPNVNLPACFENAPPENQCLYVMVLALDACFRLKRRLISSELRDPGLGTGWAYLVEPEPYRKYLLTVTDQKEMSTCSGLAALDYANTKFSRGYSTTGVVMGVCARHEFVQPNGVGDLQKGERYANTDWVFASILRHLDPRIRKIISYDIVCQWATYVVDRLKELPPLMRLAMLLELFRFVIPKMHIHGHTLDCQLRYSLNYVPGSGQTDGEGIERPWASIGGIATSTRVSGPGARHDALDCHWSFWNWLKTIGLPALLRRRLDVAKREEVVQKEAFDAFTFAQQEHVPEWKRMVEEYEADGSKPNPYESTAKGLSEAEVRKRLEEEEEREEKAGQPRMHEVSPSAFINLGLDLEEQQRKIRLQVELKKTSPASSAKQSVKQLRSKFNRRLTRFRALQATYQPAAIQSLLARDVPAEELPEHVPLMLPSALPRHLQQSPGCMSGIADTENALREGQCSNALVRLRNQLHVKSRLLVYKQNHSRYQAMNTRSRALIARNENKIRSHSEKFQMAWQARLSLSGGDERAVGWPRLRKADIRCMEDAEALAKKGDKRQRAAAREQQLRREGGLPEEDVEMGSDGDEEGVRASEKNREVSWIWARTGSSGTDGNAELQEALRIEWAKAWARSRRWKEERRMLEEEWRRLSASHEYRERLWRARGSAVPVGVIDAEVAEGKVAYAAKQANLYLNLRVRAEAVRTAAPLQRGEKRKPTLSVPFGFSGAAVEEGNGSNSEGNQDEDRGDIESEEEVLAEEEEVLDQ
ncbi:hypothetical protein FB45DRAFT_1037941 [Roridomyces roridus]|uniref:CxC2-like cysteine cluster KDZ transposase-associated domain-containing protein n=1 Tax=Roridomyces roridus TaxID=1738132 RepID=A0AAD7B588_9AGAR|nr:hypothetical protein FB45DRAFT_1037941 [Roridomyces roridus]